MSKSSSTGVRIIRHDREALKRLTTDVSNKAIEKSEEVSKAVIPRSVDAIPTSSVIVAHPVKALVFANVPVAAPFINSAIDSVTQSTAHATVASLKPKIDPSVDSIAETAQHYTGRSIKSSVDKMPNSLF